MPLSQINRRQLLISAGIAAAAAPLHSQNGVRFRLKSGLVAYSYRQALQAKTITYEQLINNVAEFGLDGFDMTVYWLPESTPRYLASLWGLAYRNAVQIYSVAAGIRLSQPTRELQDKEVEQIKKWVDVAERVGAGHVRVFGGPIPKAETESQAIDYAVEVLKRGADYSASKGIFLGIEDDSGLSRTAEPTLEIIKRTDSPWAGMNLDTGNFPKNGYAQTAVCIPYAVSTHMKIHITDANGVKQIADWDRLLQMFGEGGYKGYVSLEFDGDQDQVNVEVARYAAKLRTLVRKYTV